MKKLLLVLVLALPLFGGQSLQLTTGDAMSFTPPEETPWTSLGAFRVEISATINACSSTTSLFKIGTYNGFCSSSSTIWLSTGTDSGSEDITGKTDVVLRIQRDPSQTLASSNGVVKAHLELWNADGTGRVYQATSDTGAATFDASSAQSWSVGTSDIEFHWIKMYSTLVEVGTNAPLPDPHGTGDLANWDFEGDATDSGPDGMNFSVSGTGFTTSRTLNPVADPAVDADPYWMQQPSVRAGQEVTLSASRSISHDDVDGLTCLWTYEGGGSGITAPLFTGSTTACETTAVFPLFGEYEDVCLEVTDDSANTGKTCLDVGAVATDDNHIVVMDDDAFAFALGENIQWGQSAWPYLPRQQYRMAEQFILNRADPEWQTLGAGTISVTNGSATVTGSGTNFQATYCSGGSTPDDNAKLIVVNDDGVYVPWNITSCDSATQLTMSANWNKASDSGLSYSFWTSSNVFFWANGSDNENYYDNVWAYYLLCKTSGFQWACDAARDLAAQWWTMPFINEGLMGTWPNGGANISAPRIDALIGIMLWAKDQGTESTVFPGIQTAIQFFDNIWITHPTTYCPTDPREAWYVGMWLSLAAELDPDSGRVSNYETILGNAMDASAGASGGDIDPDVCRWPNGGWTSGGISTPNAGSSTVAVVNGTNEFLCASSGACSWTSGDVGKYVQIGVLNNKDYTSDRGQYLITAQDADKLTVSPSFAGTTGSGRFYFIRTTNTYVHQALGNAIANLALDWQYKSGFSDYRQAIIDSFDYIQDKVYWEAKKGLYNLSDEAGCLASILAGTASPDGNNCQFDPSSTAATKRFLSMEIASTMAFAVKYGRQLDDGNTAARIAFADTLFGAAMGGLKGPSTDTTWAEEYDDDEATFTALTNGKQKNFGFCCGVGGATMWDAERLGGLAAEDLVSYSVPLDIAGVSMATKASVTLYEPRGFSRVVNDQTGSTASVTGDARQGPHLAKVEYKDAGDVVLQTDYLMTGPTGEALNGATVEINGASTATGSFTVQ